MPEPTLPASAFHGFLKGADDKRMTSCFDNGLRSLTSPFERLLYTAMALRYMSPFRGGNPRWKKPNALSPDYATHCPLLLEPSPRFVLATEYLGVTYQGYHLDPQRFPLMQGEVVQKLLNACARNPLLAALFLAERHFTPGLEHIPLLPTFPDYHELLHHLRHLAGQQLHM